MPEALSPTEVESLLASLEGTFAQPATGVSPANAHGHAPLISTYDFKRPERVSKEQMRALQALHETFSREFGASLSTMLRAIIEVKLVSVDQLTYNEYVFSLENPTCFNLLYSEGLEGHFVLDLNPAIVFPIIDRLLGGGKVKSREIPNRPLTEIEWNLISRITSQAILALEHSWANIRELKLKVAQLESNPQLVQIVPPNEVVVLISFEIVMGETRGIMNLCLPFNTIEPLSNKLSADSWAAYQKKGLDPEQRQHLTHNLEHARVGLVVWLARGKLTLRELARLEVGDVILTETPVHDPAEVCVEGTPLFHARVGTLNGLKAVQIESLLARMEDVLSSPEQTSR
ncbi:MAG: flagellar motor switch protein FliM [Planctomycetaceae bacterium]|nr:MAG: flagellar motor switch protein FliM [Planctomycetaceae bacterium]